MTKSGEDTQAGTTSEGQLPQEGTGDVTEGTQGGEPVTEQGEGWLSTFHLWFQSEDFNF